MSVRPRLAPFAVAVSLATSGAGASAQRRAEAATVRGIVFDSVAQEPLADAAVFLWNTPHRAVSAEDGSFVIEDVPPGRYDLLFFHTRLGEMGASVGPRRLTLEAGDEVEVSLATPSMFTLVSSECLLQEHAPNTGTVVGWVGDGDSGTGMPGAHVTLTWAARQGGTPRIMHLRSDAGGWFRTCDAPSDVVITASASFLNRQGHRREVVVRDRESVPVDFLLYRLQPAQVNGRIVDAVTGEAVVNAEVSLRGTQHRALTGGDGGFRFADVAPGTYTLFADHLRYGTKRDTLSVPSGETLSVEMRVDERPIEIAPLIVEVESQLIAERAMGGIAITRSDIAKVRERVRDIGDIMRTQNIPGVIVKRRSDGSTCVGYMPGQVRIMWSSTCVPMIIFINNVRANSEMLALQIPPEAIERIVVYRPIEAGNLFGMGSGNGVMTIFTRSR